MKIHSKLYIGGEWGEIGFDEFLEYKSVLGSEIKN